MPYLKVQTSGRCNPDQRQAFLAAASRRVAELLGKPEQYVMVALEDGAAMLFGADAAPCVYMELKSIGLPESRTGELSESLAALVEEGLGIGRERIYIEFANAERHLWGYNGATFAR